MASNMSIADSIIGNINAEADVRIIFLDVDGVINHPSSENGATTVCPECVNKLKSVLSHTSAKIVLSSTWRLNKRHRKTLFRHLRAIELDQGVVVGETRDLRKDEKNRAEEINDWLSNPKLYKKKQITALAPWQVQTWVSLDDLDLAGIQPNMHVRNRHIKLDPLLGLCGTDSIVTTVVQRLIRNKVQGYYGSEIGVTNNSNSHHSESLLYLTGTEKLQTTFEKNMPWLDEAKRSHFKKFSTGHGLPVHSEVIEEFVELGEEPDSHDVLESEASTELHQKAEPDSTLRSSRSPWSSFWMLRDVHSSSKTRHSSARSVLKHTSTDDTNQKSSTSRLRGLFGRQSKVKLVKVSHDD